VRAVYNSLGRELALSLMRCCAFSVLHTCAFMVNYLLRFALSDVYHIFTSALKSDVTIVFLEPDFFYEVEILAIRPYIRVILKLKLKTVHSMVVA